MGVDLQNLGTKIAKNTVSFFKDLGLGNVFGFGDGDKKDKDDPPVEPITLEVDEEYAQGDTLDLNMMSALEKIRKNQAIRSGLVEKGIIQDNEPMLANKGGLAGLFRVRNQ